FAITARDDGMAGEQSAHGLLDLASEMSKLGDPAKADGLFAQALAIAEQAVGPDHPVTVAIVNNAGANRMEAFHPEGAAPFYARALAAKERVYGAGSMQAASAAKNLGIVRREQRRLPEARALLERAVARLGEHPLGGQAWAELAGVARLEGHGDDALADLDRALAILRAVYKELHPDIAEIERLRADLLLALGRRGEAEQAVAAARDLDTKLGAGPAERGETLRLEADVAAAAGRAREAMALHEQALAILERERGPATPGLVPALVGLPPAQPDAR